MRRCTYCGKEYDDAATVCAVDLEPVVPVLPAPEGSSPQSNPSVEFLRLLFNSPKEEEFAIRCAHFLTQFAGDRINLLRPDTRWSEILGWFRPTLADPAFFAMVLKKKFGVNAIEILANPEFTTFRDLVEYVCSRADKAA